MICVDQVLLKNWFLDNSKIAITNKFKAIGTITKDGTILGALGYDLWTGVSCETHCVCKPGFVTKELIWTGFDYCFNQLDCNFILGRINSSNKASSRLAEHLGYSHIATIPGVYPDGDQWIYRMYKHECKWLEILNGRWRRYSPSS